ncbi:NADP-dependent oxidoreductase [Kutzneria buriramensis]|uniref:NADPH:quinone reductase-like Zn-dependent oxidoreductase n=1 Tax=Kutzneria buriramensis TaxID=1045776 RepID=A0A3E0HBJ3_9PSEU|nr:NADP-dependent oxidoreductase [Kutzneria buriramensis]REH41782.1 NADPH:quinone reductase-like Zn-dependent oxidoreductase [Kutzneria buriramensis]
MPKAVRYNEFGGIDVLDVVEVDRPVPGPGEALVQVKAAGINPGEASIRQGAFAQVWPSTFPSGQGSDLAGVVAELGADVSEVSVGDEVIGWTDDRASQAEFVVVPVTQLTPKPAGVTWEQAGSLFVAGTTAWAAVRAVALSKGDTVVVSGAAGGVGSLVVQLAVAEGANVIGIAGPSNQDWLAAHGVTAVEYGDGLAERVRKAAGGTVDAFIDTYGADYVELALELGVDKDRINTIINFPAVEKYGIKAEGNAQGASAEVLAELAGKIAASELELIVARTYPLAEVRDAYAELERRHTRGKIVLIP